MCENLSLQDFFVQGPIFLEARGKWFKLGRNLSGSGAREAQAGRRPGCGGAPLPSPSGAVSQAHPAHPTGPPSPSEPLQAPPSPSEARQVAPIRAPTRPAPVRRHLAPCHELKQLTTGLCTNNYGEAINTNMPVLDLSSLGGSQ